MLITGLKYFIFHYNSFSAFKREKKDKGKGKQVMFFPLPESSGCNVLLANILCNCGLCNLWTSVFSSCPELTLFSLAFSDSRAVFRVPFHDGGIKMCFVDAT